MSSHNRPSSKKKAAKANLPKIVIAVGASAGGLEALQEFLSKIPPIADCCILIAQHMSPTHKSRLVQLLSKCTSLEVKEAENGEKIESQKVYVTPPDKDILLQRGNILLQQPASQVGPKPSVDLLFQSLAKSTAHSIIGVILSGTGTDGARGLRDLKKNGGLILAQDPKTAKYDGMPNAAINTQEVDSILPPNLMGDYILTWIKNPQDLPSQSSEQVAGDSSLEKILWLLGQITGTDFSAYKSATIGRRIEKRLQSLSLSTYEAYLEVLEKDPNEVERLFNTLLIGVTSFFRDMDSFQALDKEIESLLRNRSLSAPLRIWVPGCSTGEEAYSIAILLNERIKTSNNEVKFQIFATDVDEVAITKGRRGTYSAELLENLPNKWRDTYFEKLGNDYQVIKKLRTSVLFSKHDLLKNPPFLKLDLISCRNLLIYFSSGLQQQVIPLFHYSLQVGGILFLGKSENIGHFSNLFHCQDQTHKLFVKRNVKNLHNLKFSGFKASKIPLPKHHSNQPESRELGLKDKIKETLSEGFEHPYVVVNEELDILEVNGDVRLYLSLSPGSIQVNIIRLVNEELKIEVRAILTKVLKERRAIKGHIKRFSLFGKEYYVRVSTKPVLFTSPGEQLYIVIFENLEIEEFISKRQIDDTVALTSQKIHELENDLSATKEHLQTYIEQIESSNEEMQTLNEELQSTNEELQSSNEELETSNEELQSTNEEIQIAYTELKAAFDEIEKKEEALKRLQANTEALLNNDLQSFILVDKTYNVINFNRKAAKLFETLSGKGIKKGGSIMEILPSGHVEDFMQDFSLSCTGKIFQGEKVFKDTNQLDRSFSVNFTPAIYANEKVEAISLGYLEITDLKETAKKLQTTENLVTSVFNVVATGICITNKKGYFVEVNKAYCDIYGYSREELIGKSFTMMVAPEHREQIQREHDLFIENGKEHPSTYQVIGKDGGKITISVSAELLVNPDGERLKITSITDITKETEIANNLEHTLWQLKERAKEQACMIEIISFGSSLSSSSSYLQKVTSAIPKGYQFPASTSAKISYGEQVFTSANFKKGKNSQCFKGETEDKQALCIEVFTFSTNTPVFLPEEQALLDSIGKNLILTINHHINSKRIAESERRFKNLVQRGADLICIVDTDGVYTYVSPNYETLLGYKPEELLGKNGLDFIHPEDLLQIQAIFEKHGHKVKITSPAYRFKAKNGKYLWLQGTSTKMLDDPTINGIVINTMNVTPLIETQLQLEASEEKYRNLFHFSPLPKWIYQVDDFRIIDVNLAAINEYGYSKDEFLKLTIKELRPKSQVPRLLDAHKEAELKDGIIKFGIFTHQRKDGSQMLMSITGQKLRFKGKECMMVDCIDVTEREKLTHELLSKEAKLEKAHEVAKMGYWSHQIDNDTIFWSSMMHKIWENNMETPNIKMDFLIQTIHPDDRDLIAEERNRLISGKSEHFDLQHRIITPSGRQKWIHSRAYVVKDPHKDETIIEGTSQDITDQKDQEIQKQLENKLSSIFNQEESLARTLEITLNYLLHFFNFDIGEAWIVNPDQKQLNLIGCQTGEKLLLAKRNPCQLKTVKKGDGLAGKVWENNEIWEWKIDKTSKPLWKNLPRDSQPEFSLGIPLVHGDETIGVLLFGTKEKHENITYTRKLLQKLVNMLGIQVHRKKLEEELSRIFNSSPDIICVAGTDGYYKKVNPAMCDLLGFSEEEILSTPMVEFTHPEDRNKTAGELDNINRRKGKEVFENRFLTKSGKTLWLSWNSRFFLDEGLIYAVAKDVTKQKELELLLDNATSISRVGAWEINLESQEVYFSKITKEIHELEEKEIVQVAEAINFFREDVRGKIDEAVSLGIAKGEPWDLELPLITAKGNERWVRTIGKPAFKEGKCIRLIGSIQDIHSRKMAELRLQHTADNIPGVIFQYRIYPDGSDQMLHVTKGALEIWGISPEEVMENPERIWAQVNQTGDMGKLKASIQHSMEHLEKWHCSYRIKREDGEVIWVEGFGTPHRLGDGSTLWDAVIIDITEKKNLETLWEKASKLTKIGSWEENQEDEEHQYTYWSPMAREILELDQNESISLTQWEEKLFKTNKDAIVKAFHDLRDKGKEFDLELLMQTGKNKPKWVRVIGNAEITGDGSRRIFGSIQDIHQRKTAELELAQKTDYLFALANIIETLLAKEDWAKALDNCFEIAGKATRVNRVYYFEKHTDPSSPEKEVFSQRFEWNSGEFPSQMDNPALQNMDIRTFSEFEDTIAKGSVYQASVSSLPSSNLKTLLQSQLIKSIMCIPIFLGKEYYGFIGFDDCEQERVWHEDEVTFLLSISSNLSTAILQRQNKLALKGALDEKEQILESIQDGFFALDKNWTITYWNKVAERMLGRKKKEVMGKNVWDEFREAVSLKFYDEYHRAIKENIPVKFEEYFAPVEKWFDVSAFPSPLGLTVYFKDITEKKMAELELLRFQRIIENSKDGIALASATGQPLYVNPSFAKSLGYTMEELREKGSPGTVYADKNVASEVFGTLLSGKFWKGDIQLINKVGEKMDFFLSGGPIIDENDELVAIFGIHTDISERKKAEEKIRLSNERFQKVTEATQEAIWDWDIINDSVFFGEGYFKLFGYDPNNVSLSSWSSKIHPDDQNEVSTGLQQALDDPNISYWQSEYKFLKNNDDYAIVMERGMIMRDKKGKAFRMVGSMMDMTRQKEYENSLKELNLALENQTNELARSNAELEQFAYVASHDLQEPLRMVTSFLTQLNKKYRHKLDEKGLSYIDFAVDGASRMRNIILDLLDFSRIGKAEEELTELDFNQLTKDILTLHQSLIKEKKANIHFEDLPTLRTYKTPLLQVMQNLISNALKYSRPGVLPNIKIVAIKEGEKWIFSVSDNGIGIEEEYFEKIFVIFQRLHTKHEYAGTGMGLAIVKKILEHIGEEIWLTSNPGAGSTFYFTHKIH